MLVAPHALHHAVHILHKLFLKHVNAGHHVGVFQPEMMMTVEIQMIVSAICRQLILIFLTGADMREVDTIVEIQVAQRRNHHTSRTGTNHLLSAIVSQSVDGVNHPIRPLFHTVSMEAGQ